MEIADGVRTVAAWARGSCAEVRGTERSGVPLRARLAMDELERNYARIARLADECAHLVGVLEEEVIHGDHR